MRKGAAVCVSVCVGRGRGCFVLFERKRAVVCVCRGGGGVLFVRRGAAVWVWVCVCVGGGDHRISRSRGGRLTTSPPWRSS